MKTIKRVGRDIFTFPYKKNTHILNANEYEDVICDLDNLWLSELFKTKKA